MSKGLSLVMKLSDLLVIVCRDLLYYYIFITLCIIMWNGIVFIYIYI